MTTAEGSGFGIDEIMRRLPHRYPFLLVDRVVECVSGERITSVKNVSANEQFFTGHFPAAGQRCVDPRSDGADGRDPVLRHSGHIRMRTCVLLCWHRQGAIPASVMPGDQLLLRATLTRRIRTIWRFLHDRGGRRSEACSAEVMVMPDAGASVELGR
jgi:3-hydroxyacyl-[acyl-carrier-protein] dehydratase